MPADVINIDNLSLDMAWKLMLEHWRFIAHNARKKGYSFMGVDTGRSAIYLKKKWLNSNKLRFNRLPRGCFFCEYALQNALTEEDRCKQCPGVLVNPKFRCTNPRYHSLFYPRKFYCKLLKMYKKYQKTRPIQILRVKYE